MRRDIHCSMHGEIEIRKSVVRQVPSLDDEAIHIIVRLNVHEDMNPGGEGNVRTHASIASS